MLKSLKEFLADHMLKCHRVVCRYYFKRACNDFDSGFVYEELTEDNVELPMTDGKICAKVVRMIS